MTDTPDHRFDRRFPRLRGTIFVVTYGRSGSTLLQNLLMTIPDCTIRGENLNLIEGLWLASRRSEQARHDHPQAGEASRPWYGANQIDSAGFAAALVDAMVDHVLRPPPEARWFGFKEIRYHDYGDDFAEVLDLMRAQFKNARFVFNMRRAQDVARSMTVSPWWQEKLAVKEVAAIVAAMDARFRAYHAAHPGVTTLLDYDVYHRDPEALRPLFAQLDERFDAAAIARVMSTRLTH